MRSRVALTSLTSLAIVAVGAQAAYAGGPGGWVDVDDDGSEVELGATDGDDTPGGSGGTSCSWSSVSAEDVSELWASGPGADSEIGPGAQDAVNPYNYDWYWVTCPDGAGGTTNDLVPVPRPGGVVDPTSLRDEALDRLALPTPTVAMNPSGDQVVHVESWLWIDGAVWRTHEKSVTAGAVTTTVTATPQRVIWDLGNGDTVVCYGPGTPYDTSRPSDEQTTDCSYTYAHTSAGQPGDAFQATATIEWAVTWTVAGAAGGGELPALFTSSPVAVRVAEMQALNQ